MFKPRRYRRTPASTAIFFAPRKSQAFFKPVASSPIQAKLQLGAADDRYEKEADSVAEQIMQSGTERLNNSSPPNIQRLESEAPQELQRQTEAEEELVQAKEQHNQKSRVPQLTPVVNKQIESLQDSGQALQASERAFFEPRFDHRFNQVRVHTDSHAQQLAQAIQAKAFTVGNNIVFNSGQYQPHSESGRHLVAHELTHVVQQSSASVRRVQRIPMVTTGEYGKALNWFLDMHVHDPIATRLANALKGSTTFIGMAGFLNRKVIFPWGSGHNRFDDIRNDGFLVDAQGHSIGKRSLVVYPSTNGNFFAVHGTPIPGLDSYWDSIMIEHPRIGATTDEKVAHYASKIAHETRHAQNVNSSAGPAATTEQTAITQGVTEESGVRSTEAQVMQEIRRARRLPPRQTPTNPTVSEQVGQIEGGTATADVERSFISQAPMKTYLESFLFDFLKNRYRGNSTPDELSAIMRTVNDMELDAGVLNESFTLTDYGQALGMYSMALPAIRRNVEWATFFVLERLFGMEWEAFQDQFPQSVPDYFDAKEEIIQRHLRILERTGSVSYSGRIAHP